MEKRMKIKLIANRDGGYTESFKMYRMSYEYSKLTEETDPASQFYSDDDDTQSLENQMRNQYNNVSTQPHYEPRRPEPAFTPALSSRPLIPIEEAIARFEVRNNPPSEPIVEPKPKSLTHDYDDILNSIG
jgi:hypothetical protein